MKEIIVLSLVHKSVKIVYIIFDIRTRCCTKISKRETNEKISNTLETLINATLICASLLCKILSFVNLVKFVKINVSKTFSKLNKFKIHSKMVTSRLWNKLFLSFMTKMRIDHKERMKSRIIRRMTYFDHFQK